MLFNQLFHTRTAALAGLLIALNPFHVALSRVIHHDALSTNFILTSSLSLIIYLAINPQRRWLVLSGIMAGLGMLTKLTGFFMIPYFGLLGLLSLLAIWARKNNEISSSEALPLPQPSPLKGEGATPLSLIGKGVGSEGQPLIQQDISVLKALTRLLVDGILWFVLAVMTYILLWPALWVIPSRVFNTLFSIGSKYASTPHAKGVFFLGEPIRADPGVLFYPVVWLFRSPVWTMIGVVIAFIFFAERQTHEQTVHKRDKDPGVQDADPHSQPHVLKLRD